ncbi:DUF2470 domain-containing protein [Micromonosporaceae bacterium Da 78-11]
MQPSHAEVARTLAAGHLPAVAHIACRQGPVPVRHVTDPLGRVLLLSPVDGAFTAAMHPQEGTDDTAMVLDISDVPPMAGSPSLGRVWVSGWAVRLDGDEARAAALDYADVDASGDLLDIGVGQVLHRMDVAEVRYERDEVLVDVDPDEFAEAGPDPLRQIEFDLIADLADHHVQEMSDYVRRQLGPAAQPDDDPRVVRLDRYGFLVRVGNRLARLGFPRPVTDRHDLAHLLHPVLCHRCTS